jgi:hypothetical protein
MRIFPFGVTVVINGAKLVDELRQVPDEVLSFPAAVAKVFVSNVQAYLLTVIPGSSNGLHSRPRSVHDALSCPHLTNDTHAQTRGYYPLHDG